MKKSKLIVSTALLSSILLSGCSFSNPFGIGHEKSACEMSSKFGVCGQPKKIYQHRDKIKKVQQDYMKSGYDEELFFGINDDGNILVKSEREDTWQRYDSSDIRDDIEELLQNKKSIAEKEDIMIRGKLDLSQDIPVTKGNDLSVSYKSQSPLVETRTNVGKIVRDNGLIQKIWIAPVVDSKNDLISAHEIYLVVKDPKWVVGEDTPKATKGIGEIPTPISTELLNKANTYNKHEENVVNHFNDGNKGGLLEEIANDPEKEYKQIKQDLNEINNFIKE